MAHGKGLRSSVGEKRIAEKEQEKRDLPAEGERAVARS